MEEQPKILTANSPRFSLKALLLVIDIFVIPFLLLAYIYILGLGLAGYKAIRTFEGWLRNFADGAGISESTLWLLFIILSLVGGLRLYYSNRHS